MKYRNTVTGNVIETECEISGKNWQPLGAASKAPVAQVTEPEPVEAEYDDEDDSDLDVEPEPVKAKGKKK